MKNILIFFDGTGNEPGDADQDRECQRRHGPES